MRLCRTRITTLITTITVSREISVVLQSSLLDLKRAILEKICKMP